ncbi:hypothetical protein DVDV_2941 [Desulfovibrio sp. DV]|nr:hypothetical protein DVDV_2941 [Desulfovibrio sp. DV]
MFLARRQVRQTVAVSSDRLRFIAATDGLPPGIERGAAAVPDAEQKTEPLAVFGILSQPAAVTAGSLVPVQVRAARQITIANMRFHARVRQAAPTAADAGQGTQQGSR